MEWSEFLLLVHVTVYLHGMVDFVFLMVFFCVGNIRPRPMDSLNFLGGAPEIRTEIPQEKGIQLCRFGWMNALGKFTPLKMNTFFDPEKGPFQKANGLSSIISQGIFVSFREIIMNILFLTNLDEFLDGQNSRCFHVQNLGHGDRCYLLMDIIRVQMYQWNSPIIKGVQV